MPRLRRVSPATPGWHRHHSGRGFRYTDADGRPLAVDDVQRVRDLVIPPAWRDVWICPLPNGHLQATGLDAAGRRQYLYHPKWRERQDRLKFDRVLAAAELMPKARTTIRDDLARKGMPLERASAAAVRLLDLGYFRIGNDYYTDANGSFGLTTLERQHVRRKDGALVFRFIGKSGIEHNVTIDDPDVIAALQVMRSRRDASRRLLAYRNGSGWTELASPQVNSYLGVLFDGELTAKDFRTWHATVIAAETLALTDSVNTATARKRAVRAAVAAVAGYLGNTPTVARNSYIDPRVLDRFDSGTTIASAVRRDYPDPSARQAALERAVLHLLTG